MYSLLSNEYKEDTSSKCSKNTNNVILIQLPIMLLEIKP